MEEQEFGACVVLTLPPNNLPDNVEGGQHITLAYLGDHSLDPVNHLTLLNVVAELAQSYYGTGELETKSIEYFGQDGDAVVLTLDDSNSSEAVQIRQELLRLLTPELYEIFKDSETFPDYKPHMTLGYKSEGYSDEAVDIPEILLYDSIAVWNGDERISFIVNEIETESSELAHIGIKRRSGRYPWGSGKNPNQRSRDFLGMVDDLKKQGLSEKDIAEGLGLNTRELRANKAIAKSITRRDDEAMAIKLKDKGLSNVAIGERMGINESSVRSLLDPVMKERRSQLENTATMLKDQMKNGEFLDVGEGTEQWLGVSRATLKTAVSMLEDEGYKVQYLNVKQLGTGKDTKTLVLTPGDVTYSELLKSQENIKTAGVRTEDGGKTWAPPEPPKNFNSKRLEVRYAEDGGTDMDGVIEIRPGAKDLSLGNSRYAQVRIAVDGSHYLKGMAIYSNDLPDGVDVRFNTNKTKEQAPGKLDALKKMTDDPANPWGAQIKTGGQRGVLNIVNEEGDWYKWSKNLSSQMLSKQSPELAKKQLDLTYDIKKSEFDEIMSLNNPTVRKHLLEKFSDGADSSAVYLKAKGLPGTQNHVILPIKNMKETEIYAPQYKDGDRVVLIRHPHGGIFEIPELTVNNKQRAAKGIIGQAIDAVGIHPKVAEQLSGADFDGDTVLVIPNRNPKGPAGIRTAAPLRELKNFDAKTQYGHDRKVEATDSKGKKTVRYFRNGSEFKGMSNTQTEMGMISNLITDMTIQGASNSELARAVKHSMVVIDAEKHGLNYKQSAQDNGVAELKKKYQSSDSGGKGAATLISRAKGQERVLDRGPRKAQDGGPIDKTTGKKVYTPTGKTREDKDGNIVPVTQRSTKMAETDDAFTLVSRNGGTPIEKVYASHANKLKELGNQARLELTRTPNLEYSPSAKAAYSKQVLTLNQKLNTALKNAPLERKAQIIANATVKQKRLANPGMDKDSLKKLQSKALAEARVRTGAGKTRIVIDPTEWEAIQRGAISNNKLAAILRNTDLDEVKKLATPRTNTVMSPAKTARAKALAAAGYTQAEIAEALGIPKSTINDALL